MSTASAPSTVSTPSTASAPSSASALTRSLYNSIPLIHDNVESYILSTTSHNPSTHFSAVLTYLHLFQSSHTFLRSSNLFTHFPIQSCIPPPPAYLPFLFSRSSPRFPPSPAYIPFLFFPIFSAVPPLPCLSPILFSPSSPRSPPCIFHNSKPLLIYKFCLRYVIFKKNVFIGKRITL